MSIPVVALNDGHGIPQLGFGVYRVEPDRTAAIVGQALEVGYRHIDTAGVYGNELGVGRAIAASGLDRDSLFVTTKVWPDGTTNHVRDSFERSLTQLGLDYVDLYLLHWPLMPPDLLRQMWTTFEEIQQEGLVRSIGVSNFTATFLAPMVQWAHTIPAVNQLELHPAYQQRSAVQLGREHDIVPEGWGPLGQGRVDYPSSPAGEIARELGVSWAQVLLRWHVQLGHVVIPKSNRMDRMQENVAVFDFELSREHMARIAQLDDPSFPAISPDNGSAPSVAGR